MGGAATYTSNETLVDVLPAGGADPNGRDANRRTALHVATFWGFEDIVRRGVRAHDD